MRLGPLLRHVLLASAVLWSLVGPAVSANSPLAEAASAEDPTQKATDLARARANAGVSPDRLVVVYRGTPTALATASRDRAGAMLLRSDRNGRREVIRTAGGNASALAAELKQRPDVLDAYPDHVVHSTLAVNDPLLDQQWGLTKVNAPSAWETTQGSGATIAVLDCGIHGSHPDLAGRVVQEHNFTAAPTTDDVCNHGTHVAGILAADANDGMGGAGVAPAARLLNGKVLDDSGSGFFSDVASGVEWAADNGANVINLSLGASMGCEAAMQQAVDYAWGKGAVVVAAAGNAGASGAEAPANCNNVIGVAAVDQNDARASWSNYGANVAVAAPGVNILSTVNPDVNGGIPYVQFSGTSMAAPFVSGVAALLFSSPYGTNASSVRDRLFSSADKIGATGSNWTYGRVNAALAVKAPASGTPAPTSAPLPTASPTPSPLPVLGNYSPVPQVDQGLNGGWAIDDTGHANFVHSLSSSLGGIHDSGAGWVRVVFRLGACYPNWTAVGCDGRTALQAYDEVLTNVQAHNLRVLGVLTAESWPGTQADWTANNAETAGGTGDNPFVQAFAQQAAGVLAQHFAGKVSDWEVWNEPNAWTSTDGQGHFFGSSYLYPSNYAWLLQRSYRAIKNAQPSSHVLFGGLFAHEAFGAQAAVLVNGQVQHVTKRADMPGARTPAPRGPMLTVQPATACTDNTPPGSDSGASYLCATYSVGLGYASWTPGAYPFDFVSQHLYLGLGASVAPGTLTTYLDDLRIAYVGYEGPATPKRTIVTEVGWPTDQVSPQIESDNLRVAFQTLRATAYVQRSFWFNTQDAPEAGLYYGLVDTNGAAKPAYGAYQQYATFQTPVFTPPPPSSGALQSLAQPQRLADTRSSGGAIESGAQRCFLIAGVGGIPADASAVVLNATAVGFDTPGWLTVYPNGQSVPATSTLNYDHGEYAMANGVIMAIGSGGQVCVAVGTMNSAPGATQVILDATGYLTSAGVTAMPMLSSPQRLIDTRKSNGRIASGASRCFQVAGVDGIPSDATAVMLNVTAVDYSAPGWLTLYPAGQAVPATSTLNFDPDQYAIANATLVGVGTGGSACVSVGTVNSAPGGADVVLDATGYVSHAGAAQVPMLGSPVRLVDTRSSGGAIPSGGARCFPVAGVGGVPANATAVILNVTAVGFTAPGWLTVFPAGQPLPATSTLNFSPFQYAIANGTVIAVGTNGSVCVGVGTANGAPGSSQVVLDAVGYVAS
jgi:thermitase